MTINKLGSCFWTLVAFLQWEPSLSWYHEFSIVVALLTLVNQDRGMRNEFFGSICQIPQSRASRLQCY